MLDLAFGIFVMFGIVFLLYGNFTAGECCFLASSACAFFCFANKDGFSKRYAINLAFFWAAITSSIVALIRAVVIHWIWILVSAICFWYAKVLADENYYFEVEEDDDEDH